MSPLHRDREFLRQRQQLWEAQAEEGAGEDGKGQGFCLNPVFDETQNQGTSQGLC